MEMTLIDAGIGNEQRLAAKAESDALGNAGEHSRDRRSERPIKNPDAFKTLLPQQSRQPDQVESAPEFRAGMLKIHRFQNTGLCRKQILRSACRRSHKAHLASG